MGAVDLGDRPGRAPRAGANRRRHHKAHAVARLQAGEKIERGRPRFTSKPRGSWSVPDSPHPIRPQPRMARDVGETLERSLIRDGNRIRSDVRGAAAQSAPGVRPTRLFDEPCNRKCSSRSTHCAIIKVANAMHNQCLRRRKRRFTPIEQSRVGPTPHPNRPPKGRILHAP